jgi:ankyrin repeat protein
LLPDYTLKLKNVVALYHWHFSNQQTYKRMSVDLTNAEDFTPLHLTSLIGNLEATKALCKSGAP